MWFDQNEAALDQKVSLTIEALTMFGTVIKPRVVVLYGLTINSRHVADFIYPNYGWHEEIPHSCQPHSQE